MHSALVLVFLIDSALATNSHQGKTSPENAFDEQMRGPVSGVLPALPNPLHRKGEGDDDDSDGKKKPDKVKGKTVGAVVINETPPLPLFLFATGPKLASGEENPRAEKLTSEMIALVKERSHGARVIRLTQLRMDLLDRAITQLNVPDGTTVTLTAVFNAEAMAERSSLSLWGHGGEIPEMELSTVLNEIDRKLQIKRVNFSSPRESGRASVRTILLTSYSGKAECRNFPASVFGMSAPKEKRRLALLEDFINKVRVNYPEEIPNDGFLWFESWSHAVTRGVASANPERLSVSRYWHCFAGDPQKVIGDRYFVQ